MFCVCHTYKDFYISFIYEDTFTKSTENVYVYENMSVKKLALIFKNKTATIADSLKSLICSKILT